MAKLSASEIAAAARAGGLTKDIDVAVAIALAESGGRTDAHNAVPPDDSYGLWQINMLGPLGPQRRRAFGIARNSDLYDPVTNARAMVRISNNGSNWIPWTTYTSGRYKLHMGQASGSDTGSVVPVASKGALDNLADKISDSNFWARIGMYILGFILIVIGIVLLIGAGKARQIVSQVRGK